MQEDACRFFELFGVFCGVILHCGILRTTCIHVWMATEIVLQTLRYILSLWYDTHPTWHMLQYLRHENRIMRTTKDERVNLWIESHDMVDTLLYEVISTGTVCFIVLNDWHPQRTRNTRHLNILPELLYFKVITITLNSSFGCQHTHMTWVGKLSDYLCRRANYT